MGRAAKIKFIFFLASYYVCTHLYVSLRPSLSGKSLLKSWTSDDPWDENCERDESDSDCVDDKCFVHKIDVLVSNAAKDNVLVVVNFAGTVESGERLVKHHM